jgi:hypothetical protein
MNEEKTTIGEEIDAIILTFISHIVQGGVGCALLYYGVEAIYDFIIDKVNGFEAILCIGLGIIMCLIGIFFFLAHFILLLSVCRYCSEFAKTEITVKGD